MNMRSLCRDHHLEDHPLETTILETTRLVAAKFNTAKQNKMARFYTLSHLLNTLLQKVTKWNKPIRWQNVIRRYRITTVIDRPINSRNNYRWIGIPKAGPDTTNMIDAVTAACHLLSRQCQVFSSSFYAPRSQHTATRRTLRYKQRWLVDDSWWCSFISNHWTGMLLNVAKAVLIISLDIYGAESSVVSHLKDPSSDSPGNSPMVCPGHDKHGQ